MKKMIRCCVILIVFLTSCQKEITKPVQSTSVAIPPTSTLVETATPTSLSAGIESPEPLMVNVNSVLGLSGHLYFGPSNLGAVADFDFDNGSANLHKLPRDCYILSSGQKAICQVKVYSDIEEIYVYDMSTGQTEFTAKNISMWVIPSLERFLEYIPVNIEKDGFPIYMYDFATKTNTRVGLIDRESSLMLPWLSNTGKSIIGVEIGDDYNTDTWSIIDLSVMKDEPISVSKNIVATNFIVWSPDDAKVALVGYFKGDPEPSMGYIRCMTVALVYEPIAQTTLSTLNAPDGRCFTLFNQSRDGLGLQHSIWSPDSSKIAFLLDLHNVCIVALSELHQGCKLLPNLDEVDNQVWSLAWSPDSNYLAYITSDGKIGVFSLRDNESHLITDVRGEPIFHYGYLIWGK